MPAHVISSEQQRDRMLYTPIPKLIVSLSVPTLASQLISVFYNTADTYFVSKLSTSASAAVGVVFSLMSIIQAFGFGIGMGCGSIISRSLGNRDNERANRTASSAFFFAAAVGLLICIAGLCTLRPLMRLLGSTETILPYSESYARIILLAAPIMCASFVLSNTLRSEGEAMLSMYGICTGGLLNVALDPLFIFVLDMGVSGAALATILSQIVSFCLLLRGCTRGGNIAISLKNFSPSWARYKEIARGGTPSLFRQGLGSVATICLNFAAGIYGDAAIAGMSIVTRVLQFANSAIIGLGQGFQPVCGFNYGAKLYGRVRKAFWFTVSLAFCVLLIGSIVGIAFAPQIIAIFRKEDLEVIKIGALSLRLQCIFLPLSAFVVGSNMMLQTIGKPVKASISAAARTGLFFVPAILILPQFFGLLGVQMSQAVADLCSFVLCVPLAGTTLLEMKRLEKERAEV